MNVNENLRKIEKLSADVRRFGLLIKGLFQTLGQNIFFVYLQRNYELRLRYVLNKWYSRSLLSEEEIILVSDFVVYCYPELLESDAPNDSNLDLVTPDLVSKFSEQEKETLKDIYIQRSSISIEGFQRLINEIKLR